MTGQDQAFAFESPNVDIDAIQLQAASGLPVTTGGTLHIACTATDGYGNLQTAEVYVPAAGHALCSCASNPAAAGLDLSLTDASIGSYAFLYLHRAWPGRTITTGSGGVGEVLPPAAPAQLYPPGSGVASIMPNTHYWTPNLASPLTYTITSDKSVAAVVGINVTWTVLALTQCSLNNTVCGWTYILEQVTQGNTLEVAKWNIAGGGTIEITAVVTAPDGTTSVAKDRFPSIGQQVCVCGDARREVAVQQLPGDSLDPVVTHAPADDYT